MNSQSKKKKIIKRCKEDFFFFCEEFIKISHPMAGIIPFKLFSYQKEVINDIINHRFVVFKKPRQSGLSTITGVYALWLALFNSYKTILIVSRKDDDSKEFLRRNIKIPYSYLPTWFKTIWKDPNPDNEHNFGFRNGSIIRSLTSNKDVIRSNASSLVIIDEAAFMPEMDAMWGAGYPSLVHGGNAICISTPGAINNWYWRTWQDATNGRDIFHPINIEWYDMDWEIEFEDAGELVQIAPTKGIRECITREEMEKFGRYVSPWLEQQRLALIDGDDDSQFRREFLGQFIGTGRSVFNPITVDFYLQHTVEPPKRKIGTIKYTQPTSQEEISLDFQNDLWVWRLPKKRDKFNPRKEKQYQTEEKFVVGVDIATGEGIDYSAIQVIDVLEREQVAEWKGYIRPKYLAYMADYIGRLYNNALLVVERTGIGFDVVQELYRDLGYPFLYMEKRKSAMMAHVKRKHNLPGFSTSPSTKPLLVKALQDNIAEEGYILRSTRIIEELSIFSYLKNNKIGAEPGKGNNDDLVVALGLAFYGVRDVLMGNPKYISMMMNSPDLDDEEDLKVIIKDKPRKESIIANAIFSDSNLRQNIEEEQAKFQIQLGAVPQQKSKVVPNVLKDRINKLKRKRL